MSTTINDGADLNMTHVFNAPKKAVFNAFTTAEALGSWWGPVECKNSVISLDCKKGGVFRFKMEMNGRVNYGRFVFGEIQPYDLLEFTNSFSDEKGNIIKAPFDVQLPMEIFYRLIFTEKNGKTTITMTGQSIRATDEEQQGFRAINANVQQGFGGSFNKLSEYLSETQQEDQN